MSDHPIWGPPGESTPEPTPEVDTVQAERASNQAENANIAQGARDAVQADAVETVKINLEAALTSEADRRRHAENERLGWRIFAVLLLFLNIISVVYFRAYIHDGRKITTNTSHLVTEIDQALSPESKAKSDAALTSLVDNLVTQINGGNEKLCVKIIGILETNNILPSGTVNGCSSPSP